VSQPRRWYSLTLPKILQMFYTPELFGKDNGTDIVNNTERN
jgi:hypothetical protein